MSITISEDQTSLLKEIASRNGIENFEIDFKQRSLKGDGYTGEIIFMDIKDKSSEKVLHLVLKTAHKGDELRDKMMVDQIYIRENFMYNVIFKDFSALEDEFNVQSRFDGVAHYYGGLSKRNEECLVLDNLKDLGFKLWERRTPMDSHHVGAVMAQYGKLHALSYAMKHHKPEIYKERTESLITPFEKLIDEMEIVRILKTRMEGTLKIMKDNTKATNAIKKFCDNSLELFLELISTVDKYSVILHGDCWCNNMMFKYEDTHSEKPSQIYLLDWQTSTVGSPLRDISYFFYVCSSEDCLKSYETYAKIYHNSLSEMLLQFGIRVEDVMTFGELKEQWHKYAQCGLHSAIQMIKMMLTEQEEAIDIRELAKNDNIVEALNREHRISNNDEYERRVRLVINHMVENNFI